MFKARDTIRQTWGQPEEFYPARVAVIFSVSLPRYLADQKKIEEEQKEHGDIVQDGMFIDSYGNLTLKV